MATISWRGDAPAVAQQQTVTIGTNDAATTYKVTINGKTISVTGAGTAALTAAALLTLLNATTAPPEFQEITWGVLSNVLTGVADLASRPFTLTTSVASGTGSISNSVIVANSSPSDVNNAANWVGGVLPANGDDVVIAGGASLLYNLSALSAVTLASLTYKSSFTGTVGAPDINVDSQSNPYNEYRGTRWAIAATVETVGLGPGGGSSLIRRDGGTVQHTIIVLNTNSPTTGQFAYDFVGTHASNAMTVLKGNVGIAASINGVASNMLTLRVGYVSNKQSDSTVVVGDGVTLGTVIQSGGKLTTNCTLTTFTMTDGTCWLQTGQIGATKTGTITTMNVEGGTCYLRSTGTVTAANVSGKGTLDLTTDLRPRAITNVNLYSGATFLDKYVTNATKVYNFKFCGFNDVTLDLGVNFTATIS